MLITIINTLCMLHSLYSAKRLILIHLHSFIFTILACTMLGDANNYPLLRNVCPKLIIFLNSWTTFTFFFPFISLLRSPSPFQSPLSSNVTFYPLKYIYIEHDQPRIKYTRSKSDQLTLWAFLTRIFFYHLLSFQFNLKSIENKLANWSQILH